jgi:hypothetical protein
MAIVHETVIVECERCGKTSQPLLRSQADPWLLEHEQSVHVPEDRIIRMREHGHAVSHHVEFFDQDDSSGYITCSCGFKSRSAKVCWLDEYEQRHLVEIEQQLELQPILPDSTVTPSLDSEKQVESTQPRTRPSALAERASST